MLFLCPKCGKKLTIRNSSAVCADGHSYDRSRAGYYNLLLTHRASHGDNREMVVARRRFLSMGFYAPLTTALTEASLKHTEKGACLLDAGCGEGYYTDAVERALFDRDGESLVYALDISKDAVKELTKKNPRVTAAVASSYHIPMADGSVHTVINTFSPLAIGEVSRLLCAGGIFIMAIPAEDHLFELKSAIYDTPYRNVVADTALDGFELISDSHIRYEMSLDTPEAIASLFKMTPYAYRTHPDNAQRVYSLDSLACTADFRLFVYRKL